MTVKERIDVIRLSEKREKMPEFFEALGVSASINNKKKEDTKVEESKRKGKGTTNWRNGIC